MGGRGASSYTVVRRLKNYKNAIIPRNKLKNYILNPSKDEDKAKFFKSLGYNMNNHERLISDIKEKISTNKALKYKTDKNGDTEYQVNMQLGIDKKAIVTTGWIVRKGSNEPQFVTAYKNHKLNKRVKK